MARATYRKNETQEILHSCHSEAKPKNFRLIHDRNTAGAASNKNPRRADAPAGVGH